MGSELERFHSSEVSVHSGFLVSGPEARLSVAAIGVSIGSPHLMAVMKQREKGARDKI